MKDKIFLFSGLSIIILALFGALIGLPRVFNFFFLFIIVHSPSGVALAPHMFIASVVSAFLLNAKAIKTNIRNNLGLNLLVCFTLIIFFYFIRHA